MSANRGLEACCQFFGVSPFNGDRFEEQLSHQGQWQGTVVTGSHDGPKRLVEVSAFWLPSSTPHGTGNASWLAILRPVRDTPLLDITVDPHDYQFSLLVESAPVGLFLADPMGACRYNRASQAHVFQAWDVAPCNFSCRSYAECVNIIKVSIVHDDCIGV